VLRGGKFSLECCRKKTRGRIDDRKLERLVILTEAGNPNLTSCRGYLSAKFWAAFTLGQLWTQKPLREPREDSGNSRQSEESKRDKNFLSEKHTLHDA
jgi:hypothetical protein